MASRLLQFLASLLKVPINCTSNEFRNRSARLLTERRQLLELFFLQEESRPLHGHTVSYTGIYVSIDRKYWRSLNRERLDFGTSLEQLEVDRIKNSGTGTWSDAKPPCYPCYLFSLASEFSDVD